MNQYKNDKNINIERANIKWTLKNCQCLVHAANLYTDRWPPYRNLLSACFYSF